MRKISFDIIGHRYWQSIDVSTSYECKNLDKRWSRRLSVIKKVALDLALDVQKADGPVDFVCYASRHGELALSYELIRDILDKKIPSPLKFSQSTHNSIPGFLSICSENTAPITSISAGEKTFQMGLVSAVSFFQHNPNARVLYMYCEESFPKPYEKKIKDKNQSMVALMLLKQGDSVTLDISSNIGVENVFRDYCL